jgi:hypothetical protein
MTFTSTVTPPQQFLCSLTKEIMVHPMVSRYGHHFDRTAILDWLNNGHNYCPVSGNPLRAGNLVSDKSLQWKIQYWSQKHLYRGEEEKEESEYDEPNLHMLHGTGTISFPHKSFYCLMTKQVMDDPLVSKYGHNFERTAILKYLNDVGPTCPITNKTLYPSDLIPNRKLQWEIGQWQLSYGDAAQEMTRLELETKLSKAEMISSSARDYQLADILLALTISTDEEEGWRKDSKAVVDEESKVESSAEPRQCVMDVLGEIMDQLN